VPFHQTLEVLSQIAMRSAGAEGYTLSLLDPSRRALTRVSGQGLAGREPEDIPFDKTSDARTGLTLIGNVAVVSIPLRNEGALFGVLELTFPGAAAIHASKRAVTQRSANLIESILRASERTSRHVSLAARISRLEMELADLKIAERTRGLLRAELQEDQVSETLERHIESVLSRCELDAALQSQLDQVEDRFEERRLASEAKIVLQSRLGLTEEQAHHHMRVLSRKSRRRLKDIAKDLIENWPQADTSAPWGA
jgi:hypothetical protein